MTTRAEQLVAEAEERLKEAKELLRAEREKSLVRRLGLLSQEDKFRLWQEAQAPHKGFGGDVTESEATGRIEDVTEGE